MDIENQFYVKIEISKSFIEIQFLYSRDIGF